MRLTSHQQKILEHLLSVYESSSDSRPSDSIANLPPPSPPEHLWEFYRRNLIFLEPEPPSDYYHEPESLPESTTVSLNLDKLASTMFTSDSSPGFLTELQSRIISAKDSHDTLLSQRVNEAYEAMDSDRRVKLKGMSKDQIESVKRSLKNKRRNFMSKKGIEYPECMVSGCSSTSKHVVLPRSSIPYQEWYRVIFLCPHHSAQKAGSGELEKLPTVDIRHDLDRNPKKLSADAAKSRVRRVLEKFEGDEHLFPFRVGNPRCQVCQEPDVDPTFKRVRKFWPDYDRWFEVCFLCDTHYREVQKNERPWPKPIDMRPRIASVDEPWYEIFNDIKEMLNAVLPSKCDVCEEHSEDLRVYLPRKIYPTKFFMVCPDHDDYFSRKEILDPDIIEPHTIGHYAQIDEDEDPSQTESPPPQDFDDIMDEVMGME